MYKVNLNPSFKYLTEKATGLTLGPIRWPQKNLSEEDKKFIDKEIF